MSNLKKKLVFRLQVDASGYPPVSFESLWGLSQGQNSYVIDNVPYYICGVSKGDLVATEMLDGELFGSAVIARGGHSTLRVFTDTPESRTEIESALTAFGAACSMTQGLSLFSVDIPPAADFQKIDSYLEGRSDGEHIVYEDACLQHGGIDSTRRLECLSLASVPLRLN